MNHVNALATLFVAPHLHTHIIIEMVNEKGGIFAGEEALGIHRAARSVRHEFFFVYERRLTATAPLILNLPTDGRNGLSGPHRIDEIDDF